MLLERYDGTVPELPVALLPEARSSQDVTSPEVELGPKSAFNHRARLVLTPPGPQSMYPVPSVKYSASSKSTSKK